MSKIKTSYKCFSSLLFLIFLTLNTDCALGLDHSLNLSNETEVVRHLKDDGSVGRKLSLTKTGKEDYTDIDFGLQIPIRDPTYAIGIKWHDFIPFKTWITINPITLTLNIFKKLWELWCGIYDFIASIVGILWNTLDIFKLWAAFVALNKVELKHPGWKPQDEWIDNPDHWRSMF